MEILNAALYYGHGKVEKRTAKVLIKPLLTSLFPSNVSLAYLKEMCAQVDEEKLLCQALVKKMPFLPTYLTLIAQQNNKLHTTSSHLFVSTQLYWDGSALLKAMNDTSIITFNSSLLRLTKLNKNRNENINFFSCSAHHALVASWNSCRVPPAIVVGDYTSPDRIFTTGNAIKGASWHPTQKKLAILLEDGRIIIKDVGEKGGCYSFWAPPPPSPKAKKCEVIGMAWSPQGKMLAVPGAEGINIMSYEHDTLGLLYNVRHMHGRMNITGIVWASKSSSLILISKYSSLWRVNYKDENPTTQKISSAVYDASLPIVTPAVLDPTEKFLMVARGSELEIIDIKRKAVLQRIKLEDRLYKPSSHPITSLAWHPSGDLCAIRQGRNISILPMTDDTIKAAIKNINLSTLMLLHKVMKAHQKKETLNLNQHPGFAECLNFLKQYVPALATLLEKS